MDTRALAEKLWDWMADQSLEGQALLHAAVCCDHFGKTNFINALDRIISESVAQVEPPTDEELRVHKMRTHRASLILNDYYKIAEDARMSPDQIVVEILRDLYWWHRGVCRKQQWPTPDQLKED